jgi:hypothetical protein
VPSASPNKCDIQKHFYPFPESLFGFQDEVAAKQSDRYEKSGGKVKKPPVQWNNRGCSAADYIIHEFVKRAVGE